MDAPRPAPPPAAPQPAPIARGEPALVERARRTGWALLAAAVAAMLAARLGPAGWRTPAQALAAAAGLLGMLAIINVALVRGLYRQIAEAPAPPEPPAD